MRQRLLIIITIAVVLVLLVALNAASYVRIEKTSDLEWKPDRSTYNSGATGTRALFDFLVESGHDAMRWTEDPKLFASQKGVQTATFVIVGQTAIPVKDEEAQALLTWVANGGRLIVVDRTPNLKLLPAAGRWNFSTQITEYPSRSIEADNPNALTEGVTPVRPGQPTLLTKDVETVMPSRYAGLVTPYVRQEPDNANDTGSNGSTDDPIIVDESETAEAQPPPRRNDPATSQMASTQPESMSPAPLSHIYNSAGALLIDYKYGSGQIILLTDPFILANNGISRADNLQLALNVVAGHNGRIFFDEFHQGHAAPRNRMLAYFAGTPVIAMLGQCSLIVLALMWTRGKRFGRPLPLPRVDRRSKLEYVASMAELQQRSRAYDLAIENVYARTRRVLARYAGVDNMCARGEIAERVAARSKVDRGHLERVMRDCENAINGEYVNGQRSLTLVAELREIERSLGLRMRAREVRQSKQPGTI